MADFTSQFTEKASIIGPKTELWAVVDLNVREKPDASSAKVGSVKAGASVKDMQKLIENSMWYYSESQKGYIAAGDGKKEYWSAKPLKGGKPSISKTAAQGPSVAPGGAAVPGVSAEAMQPEGDKTALIVGGLVVAVLLFYMIDNSK